MLIDRLAIAKVFDHKYGCLYFSKHTYFNFGRVKNMILCSTEGCRISDCGKFIIRDGTLAPIKGKRIIIKYTPYTSTRVLFGAYELNKSRLSFDIPEGIIAV